jgi:catechol 1,2-dioxygenase
MNLRGVFTTDADGAFSFRTIRPAGYPVPTEGPTGMLLRAQARHNFRPAHIHFLIYKQGFKTITSQVYDPSDPHLETDSQFGVTKALIGEYRDLADGGYLLEFAFTLEAGEARMPSPPITGKVVATAG